MTVGHVPDAAAGPAEKVNTAAAAPMAVRALVARAAGRFQIMGFVHWRRRARADGGRRPYLRPAARA